MREFLIENHIWKDQEGKDKFLAKEKKITNEFWLNFLGFLALYAKYKDEIKLIQYFKQSTVRLEKVTDSDNDLMVILKIIDDKKVIPDMVMTKITKMLAKIKMGTLGGLDENMFRDEIIKRIKITTLYPYPQISVLLTSFKKGNKTLADMLPELYSLAMQHKRAHEFRVMYKRLSSPSDGTTDTVDGNSAQDSVQTTPTVSPVKSALTGAPKPDPIPVKTSVIPINTQSTTTKVTWNDVVSFIGSDRTSSHAKYAILMYIFGNGTSTTEILQSVYKFGIANSKFSSFFFYDDIANFYFNPIPNEIKQEFPTIETLFKPILGDISKVPDSFRNFTFQDYRTSFDRLFRYANMDSMAVVYDDYLFINDIETFFGDTLATLKRNGVPQSFLDQTISNIRSVFDRDFKNDSTELMKSILNSYSINVDKLLGYIYNDTNFPIFSFIKDIQIAYMSDDKFQVFLIRDNTPIKDLAKRFVTFSDKSCVAYKWGDSQLTFEDKVADGLTFDMLDSSIIKGENNWDTFYKSSLSDSGLGFKQFIEKYDLKYDDFLKEVKSYHKHMLKYIMLAFYLYGEHRLDTSYLIEDLIFNIPSNFKWFPQYSSSKYENFFGFRCLNYFASKGKWEDFNKLAFNISSNLDQGSMSIYALSDVKVIKTLFNNITSNSKEYINLIKVITKLIGMYIPMDVASTFGISKEFILENNQLFINLDSNKLGNSKFNTFISSFSDTSLDLSKNQKVSKAIEERINQLDSETYSHFSLSVSYKLNKPTLEAFKDKILDHLKRKLSTPGGRSKTIVLDLEYMVKLNVITKDEAAEIVKNAFGTNRGKLFSVLDDFGSYDSEKLKDSFLLDFISDKDTLKDFLTRSNINSDLLLKLQKPGYYTSKEATETISQYLDKNSFYIGKLYDDHGVDALVEYFSDPDVSGIWDKISSGKRLLNKTNSLEFIMLDMLSDKDKLQNIDKLLDAFPDKMKTSLVNSLKEQLLIYPILNDIYISDNPLKPFAQLTPNRIKTLLKYNNFEFTGSLVRKKPRESWASYFQRVSDVLKSDALIPDIKLEKIEETQDQLNEKTVEYSKYYNGMHGSSAVEFLESYNVNMKYPQFEEFKTRFGSDNLVPAFHASGLTASNFILRFGFTVIPADDASTVGRMLDIHNMALVKPKADGDAIPDSNDYVEYIENGYFPVSSDKSGTRITYSDYPTDQYHWRTIKTVGGIYVSNVVEKVAQYLGDEGFSRKEGTIGTIYECEVNLGTQGLHYHVAGTGGDSIRSPEWALCWPQGQINIVKAHKVKFTNKSYIKELKKKYPHVLQENKYFKSFADFLQEQEMIKSKNVITFVFHQGLIPTHKEMMPWQDFETKIIKKSNKMYVDSNQFGIGVVFHTDRDLDGVIRVPFTDEFMSDDPEGLYSQFLMLLDECKG